MLYRKLALGSILATFLAGCPSPPPPTPTVSTVPQTAVTSMYGINYPWWARMDDGSSRQMATKAAEAGLGWIRLYLPWGQIERSQGAFDWGDFGRAIDNAHAAGLAVEAVLVHPTPCWAASSCIRQRPGGLQYVHCEDRENGCHPRLPEFFRLFARAAAARFGRRVAAWALWQEPNAPEQWEGSNRNHAASEYQRLILIPGYTGIKEVISDAKITAPGVVSWEECRSHDIASTGVTPLADPWVISDAATRSLSVPLDAITIHRYGTASDINAAMDCLAHAYRSQPTAAGRRPLCNNSFCPPFWLEEFGGIGPDRAPKEDAMLTAIAVFDHINPVFERRFLWLLQGVPGDDAHLAFFHNDLQPIGDKYCALKRFLYARTRRPFPNDGLCQATASCGFINCEAGLYCGGGACLPGLAGEQLLAPGKSIRSRDMRFMLIMQTDGNLVLGWAVPPGGVLWSSGTPGHPNSFAKMQADGNLIVGSVADGVTWSPYTHNNPGAFLVVQNDGNLVIYSPTWKVLWQAGTGGIP